MSPTPIQLVPGNAPYVAFSDFYLGVPGAMRQLRIPDSGFTSSAQRGEHATPLISGGSAVARRLKTRRAWGFTFTVMLPETADLLVGFYTGMFGDGPFCLVDPSWRNGLSSGGSTFDRQNGQISAWSLSVTAGQTLALDTSFAPPFPTSGVARWSGAMNGSAVGLGTWDAVAAEFLPDLVNSAPYVSDAVSTVSVYARAVSGSPQVQLITDVNTAGGTTLVSATGSTTTLTAAWQRLSVVLPLGTAGAGYIVPSVGCLTNSSVIQLACTDLQYGVSEPAHWVMGLGVARVLFTSPGLASQSTLTILRDHSIALVEI